MSMRLTLILLLAAPLASSQTIDFATLLGEVGSLESVIGMPRVPFSARQFSSYDRRTTTPEDQSDKGWYANGDQGNFLRSEERAGKTEWVMADAEGPGAVMRIWSADPKGVLRIYLDDMEKPALESEMALLLSGRHPLAPSPMAGERSKGWNLHLPFPYAKRLKVTVSEKQLYYHVNVKTFVAGTKVDTWSQSAFDGAGDAMRAALERLTHLEAPAFEPENTTEFTFVMDPGAIHGTLRGETGRGAIVNFGAEVLEAENRDDAWRHVVLRMSFDGEPCVEVPLGDFFGCGPGMPAYASLPLGVTKEGLAWSRWIMPFVSGYDIELSNRSSKPVKVRLVLEEGPIADGFEPLHFRANWRQESNFRSWPHRDWNGLTVDGSGLFVGCSLSIANPVRGWWGEGDEKFFVDGESFPSTLGTGTEDYFGYAWCWPALFVHALHGQPRCDGPGNYGFTDVYRWHFSDAVPFTKSFRFELECWHWVDCVMSQSMTVYWYGAKGAKCRHAPIRTEELALPVVPPLAIKRVKGAIEGESMKVVASTGTVDPQDLTGFASEKWSGDQHMWWRGANVGDKLVLAFDVEKAGRYEVRAAFTSANDYGIHRIQVNDAPTGDPIDFYGTKVDLRPESSLGVFDLAQGANRLTVEITGSNPKARPGRMFGLDYLLLVPGD